MSEATTETSAEPAGGEPLSGVIGQLEDIQEALGLEPETPEEKAALSGEPPPVRTPAPAKKEKAEGEEEKATAKGDDADEKVDAKADDETSEEDKALAEWAAVKKRARDRKAARAEAQRAPAAAAPAASAAPAKKDESATTEAADGKNAKPKTEVESAVADIIAALAKLDSDDAAEPDADATAVAGKAKREVDLGKIKENLAVIAKAAGESEKVKATIDELRTEVAARIKAIDDVAFVTDLAEKAITQHEDKLPLLSKRRDAARLVYEAAAEFLERKGKPAPMAFIAERVERVLARRSGSGGEIPTKNGAPTNGTSEKKHPSKTLNSTHATPPSRRQREDERTPEQVTQDLWTSLGIDPDA